MPVMRQMSGVSSLELRRQQKQKKKARRKFTIIFILAIGAAIGILFTPLFNLSEVVLTGNEKITREEIVKTGNLTIGKNLFTFNLNSIGDKLSKIPYVNSIIVKRRLPDKIVIELSESIPMAYVVSKTGYVVIDKNGKALERTADRNLYPIPLLSDFRVSKYKLAENIFPDNKGNFKKTLEILRDLYNNSFMNKISSISMSSDAITLRVSDTLIINMGSYEQFNAKIIMVKEILNSLPDNAAGEINASNADKVYFDRK